MINLKTESSMYFIVSNTISEQAQKTLSAFGEIIFLKEQNTAYPGISSHPDIFICQIKNKLIVAPNIEIDFLKILNQKEIQYETGQTTIKTTYPGTAHYNAVITDYFMIHHLNYTDPKILELSKEQTAIHVEQGYTRCSLLPLKDNHFITSDAGIYKTLIKQNIHVLYISPNDIKLYAQPHCFIGGCCGVFENIIFINGSLKKLHDGNQMVNFLEKLNYNIIELSNNILEDCGSILIMN